MIKLLWVITLLCALIAGAVLALTVLAASGAPQQAAGAAIALAVAVIPYVLTRAAEGLR
jgi:hypothetical protein